MPDATRRFASTIIASSSCFIDVSPLLRASRTRRYPRPNERPELRLRAGSWDASLAGVPRPADQRVRRHVLMDLRKAPTAVSCVILHLQTDLVRRFTLPRH